MSEKSKWDFGWPVTIAIGTVVIGLLGLAKMDKLPTEIVGFAKWADSSNESASSSVSRSWKFLGKASTGESIFIDTANIKKTGSSINFTYRIGDELIAARADCSRDQWYANSYNKWYSPSSQATQDMLSFICK